MANESTGSMRISAGGSLIATSQPLCEGLLLFRGVTYKVKLDGCASGYVGNALVQGLKWPGDIAGSYIDESKGDIWRSQHGVRLDISPPIQAAGRTGKLDLRYLGAALPRQP